MEPFGQKLKYFFYNYWNTVTTVAVVSYVVGFAMRTFGVIETGRVILACNSVLWTMKLLDYMSVHPRLGPYITMAGKMILNMSYIIVMLVVSLLAFGLARQSITYPNEDWHWLLVRNIFYKPYFMLYGEVYADEIDTCGDEAWDSHLEKGVPITNSTSGATCVPGYWIPPVLMTFFLLVANILLMSMLIAIFK
ncbi:transporter, cation channel family protein [Ancylostoma ceylanicum]|uniref:Transporter, cation channel family protein n=1 Tax=Ancylostoma ceylanicum TaxID=53326 RepID=A0A0D6L428_9BILA|nr:transporter, cation channel family protein [Ancylostoma ceylanicum]